MRGGEDWATHIDLPDSSEQSILMGPDLDVRAGETLRMWRLSLEFDALGRNIRLVLSSHTEELGVLLDDYHARMLSRALSDLSHDDGRQRDWTY